MTTRSQSLFDVDTAGLAGLLADRGKETLIHELLQNAWDERATQVELQLERIPGTAYATLRVTDNSPDGFADLRYAYTLFAPTPKRANPAARGRFCLGDKLVIALCAEASIITTKGTVQFSHAGRSHSRTRRAAGTEFTGRIKMTSDEIDACLAELKRLLPPEGIRTLVNGEELARRKPLTTFEATLPTVVANEAGDMVRRLRACTVSIHDPREGEEGTLFERGIPVVATGDRWHVDVGQRVPVSFQRDSVPPAYLARIRALVVEHMAAKLQPEDAASTWVRDALERHGDELPVEAIRQVVSLRVGDKAVAFDLSDPEANKRAVAAGYQVVTGGSLSRAEWAAARRAGLLPPAGRVTPSPRPYGAGGEPLRLLKPAAWTPSMREVVEYASAIGQRLLGAPIAVQITSDVTWPFSATFSPARVLVLNLGKLGHRWFEGPLEQINNLLIHEFAHFDCADHLDARYYQALSRLGAKLVTIALDEPSLFRLRTTSASPAAQLEAAA